MQIYPDKLANELSREMKPVYVTCGSEFILERDVRDEIVSAARSQGIEDVEISPLSEAGSSARRREIPWNTLLDEVSESSLFGSRKVVELRMRSNAMTDRGVSVLTSVAESPPPNLLLVRLMNFDYRDKNKAWYNKLRGSPMVPLIVAEELDRSGLIRWLQTKAKTVDLILQKDAAGKIADLCEGNMLAAKQELDKLELLFPVGSTIEADSVVLADASNIEVRDLVDAVFAGQPAQVIKQLDLLSSQKQSGGRTEFMILNMITQTLMLAQSSLMDNKARVYAYQKTRIDRLNQVHGQRGIESLILESAQLNSMMLGMARGESWLQLKNFLLAVAGVRLPRLENEYRWREIDRRVS